MTSAADSLPPRPPEAEARGTIHHLRWYICGLLFFVTTINYIDRQVIGILKPVLDRDLHLSQSDYGWVIFCFQLSYAFFMPFAGRLIDWIGVRAGYALAVVVWALAAAGHSVARTAVQFGIARFFLGAGESMNFPAAFRTIAEWFPRRERALAAGLFNSGSNVGAIVAPLAVPVIAAHFGWHAAFLFTSVLSMLWLVCWLMLYRRPEMHPRLAPAELALIESDRDPQPAVRLPWLRLLGKRQMWAFLIGKVLTDPVWWFYLYWAPDYLHRKFHLDITQIGLPLVIIYVTADVGSIGGGWLSSFLLRRGWAVARARKTAMLVCAVSVTAAIFIPHAGGRLWLTVALLSIAAAAHQGWSANLFTIPSDTFPRTAVGSVVGLGGFGGGIAGMLAAPAIGIWLQWSHDSYAPLFVMAGCIYLLALLIIHLLLPEFTPEGSI